MLDPGKYKKILIDKHDDGVVVATLNRPERRNALSHRLHWEVSELPRDAMVDRNVKALVITGAGSAFSAGGDFGPPDKDESPSDRPASSIGQEAHWIVENLLDCTKPVISAVNGPAMGLGATIALLCDIVVASRSAVFADTHVKIGIGAGDGGQVIWPLLMGPNRAKYYLMTGDSVDAEEAERLGLVNFVVDDDALLPKALEIAERLAKGPGLAIAASKVPLNRHLKSIAQQILPFSIEMEGATLRSKDAKEAMKAFLEKRDPVFTGR
jgi:enoyl-CoA hydratase